MTSASFLLPLSLRTSLRLARLPRLSKIKQPRQGKVQTSGVMVLSGCLSVEFGMQHAKMKQIKLVVDPRSKHPAHIIRQTST
ncbi:hypothetical protein KC368_g51 [Hortaea werneckii]|nr:hypothetical protein KC368_g51 [Hortaea werneckii]